MVTKVLSAYDIKKGETKVKKIIEVQKQIAYVKVDGKKAWLTKDNDFSFDKKNAVCLDQRYDDTYKLKFKIYRQTIEIELNDRDIQIFEKYGYHLNWYDSTEGYAHLVKCINGQKYIIYWNLEYSLLTYLYKERDFLLNEEVEFYNEFGSEFSLKGLVVFLETVKKEINDMINELTEGEKL